MLQVSSVDLQYIWKAKGPRNFGILDPGVQETDSKDLPMSRKPLRSSSLRLHRRRKTIYDDRNTSCFRMILSEGRFAFPEIPLRCWDILQRACSNNNNNNNNNTKKTTEQRPTSNCCQFLTDRRRLAITRRLSTNRRRLTTVLPRKLKTDIHT